MRGQRRGVGRQPRHERGGEARERWGRGAGTEETQVHAPHAAADRDPDAVGAPAKVHVRAAHAPEDPARAGEEDVAEAGATRETGAEEVRIPGASS